MADLKDIENIGATRLSARLQYPTETSPSENRTGEMLDVGDNEDALALGFTRSNPDLRYVGIWGKWMHYHENIWSSDTTLAVYDKIRDHVRAFAPDKPVFRKANTITAVEKLARSDRRYAATPEQWDADDHLLNTKSGVIDLRTGEQHPHDPSLFMSKSCTVAPLGNAPRWKAFLGEVTGGDKEYESFLQRVAGYAASGHTHQQAMFFLYGRGGNGKGVFLNTIQAVMGDYSSVASMDTFTESKFDRHPTDLAMLHGARVVFAQETDSGRAWAESRIKSLTGGDPITARFMRQDFFTFVPKFKLLIAGNHKPRLRHVDDAMRRRLHLLPFNQMFDASNRDPHLSEKLHKEHGGILNWIIEGALQFDKLGLAPPEVVTAATNEYFESEDFFDQWLCEKCDIGKEHWDRPTSLFNSWKDFAREANDDPGNQNSFAEELGRRGYIPGKSSARGGRYWGGLKLKDISYDNHW